MKLEISKGSYFVFHDVSYEDTYSLQNWLYHNGYEVHIEHQPVYLNVIDPPSMYNWDFRNYIDSDMRVHTHTDICVILHYKFYKERNFTNNDYRTEFIKPGMCIVNTGSHLLFLNPNEYEMLSTGLKVLPNE